jgi:RND family efflux transporter MFP subunit
MLSRRPKMLVPIIVLSVVFLVFGLWGASRLFQSAESGRTSKSRRPVPVETATVRTGPIARQRTFNGELEAQAEFVVAPKVSGRVERVLVNIADTVQRDQVVAELDNDEYIQAVAQAQADIEVARAKLSEAESALGTADREFKRTASLLKRGIASDSEYDAARQEQQVRQAQLKVARAQVIKAEAALETANIRLGYTKVTAGWSGGDSRRIVAERYVDEGQTVAANAQLLLIVELDPIVGVVFVAEQEYARLKPGQSIHLTTDAYPGETFYGRIDRIAPIFRKTTRQARIEMTIDNPQHRLKPGMFIRATVELTRVADATIVPEQALTKRNDKQGVFIVSQDGRSVSWREVTVGIRDGGWVQVNGRGVSGRVVTLGQQLLDEGSAVTIPGDALDSAADRKAGDRR